MIDEEVERMIERYADQLKSQGISLELYYQFTKTTEEDLKKQIRPEAEKTVLYRLMLEEISTLESVQVTKEETEKEAEKIAKNYNISKEDFLKQIGGTDMLEYDLEIQKTIDLLKEYNKQ